MVWNLWDTNGKKVIAGDFDAHVCSHFKSIQTAPGTSQRNHDTENPEEEAEVELDYDDYEEVWVRSSVRS